jgi:menaquinol-cytochrome c reductase iron-sulfur subunit
VLTRREFAALALAAAAAPLTGCGDDDRWHDAGALADVPADSWEQRRLTIKGAGDYGYYVRRDGQRVVAVRDRCTHLGCPVRWVDAANRFVCPCHASLFDARGEPLGGPAKRRLERAPVRVADGRVQIAWPS